MEIAGLARVHQQSYSVSQLKPAVAGKDGSFQKRAYSGGHGNSTWRPGTPGFAHDSTLVQAAAVGTNELASPQPPECSNSKDFIATNSGANNGKQQSVPGGTFRVEGGAEILVLSGGETTETSTTADSATVVEDVLETTFGPSCPPPIPSMLVSKSGGPSGLRMVSRPDSQPRSTKVTSAADIDALNSEASGDDEFNEFTFGTTEPIKLPGISQLKLSDDPRQQQRSSAIQQTPLVQLPGSKQEQQQQLSPVIEVGTPHRPCTPRKPVFPLPPCTPPPAAQAQQMTQVQALSLQEAQNCIPYMPPMQYSSPVRTTTTVITSPPPVMQAWNTNTQVAHTTEELQGQRMPEHVVTTDLPDAWLQRRTQSSWSWQPVRLMLACCCIVVLLFGGVMGAAALFEFDVLQV